MGLVSILEAGQICVGISYGWTIYDMEIRDNELISPKPPPLSQLHGNPVKKMGIWGRYQVSIGKFALKIMQRMS